MSDRRLTRRDLLGTGAGIGTVAALGGCLSSVPGLGGDGGGGRPWYARWIPARSALGEPRGSRYHFVSLDVATVRNNEASFSTDTYRVVTESFRGETLLPEFSSVDRLFTVATGTSGTLFVVEGSFAASDLTGGLQDRGYTRRDEHAGFAVHVSERETTAVGLADGTLVVRGARQDAVEELRAGIDVGQGKATRLADASADAEVLVSKLGTALFANGTLPAGGVPTTLQSDALVGNGLRGQLSGSTTDVRQVLVYDAAGDVDTDAVRDGSATADRIRAVTVEASGRTALVEGTVDTAELTDRDIFGLSLGEGPSTGEEQVVPQATFDFEYDQGAGTLEITHAGGDAFDEDNTGTLRYGAEGETTEEWPLPVRAGDSVTLERDFQSIDTVVVVWESPDGGRTAVVADYDVPR